MTERETCPRIPADTLQFRPGGAYGVPERCPQKHVTCAGSENCGRESFGEVTINRRDQRISHVARTGVTSQPPINRRRSQRTSSISSLVSTCVTGSCEVRPSGTQSNGSRKRDIHGTKLQNRGDCHTTTSRCAEYADISRLIRFFKLLRKRRQSPQEPPERKIAAPSDSPQKSL